MKVMSQLHALSALPRGKSPCTHWIRWTKEPEWKPWIKAKLCAVLEIRYRAIPGLEYRVYYKPQNCQWFTNCGLKDTADRGGDEKSLS
jgi:hypothetical protein